ncbi:MAG: chemotaxis response regulator protein-glutamate methylesterase [Ignavibacteriales bacterium]|nr:MAG: chemotaxis response regulator protein-glutamate methylesterase [Ignavibacteriales bacterium]
MARKIKVVVVDDSAFMRKSLSIMLESDPDIEIIGTARDGVEGYELVKKTAPDIVTLDIEMPRMDGLTTLKKIMKDCPTSVLMVSSLTTEGAEATMKALEYGAVDFIPKELSFVNVNIINIREDLIRKVKEIVKQKSLRDRLKRLQSLKPVSDTTKSAHPAKLVLPKMLYKAVALGISTGGPMSLQKVIPTLSKKIDMPVFIVQHMPPKFTRSLAERLNGMSQLEVKEAEADEVVKNGVVYIAPGGYHMTVKKNSGSQIVIKISDEPSTTLHRPSVDVMINSVVEIYGKHTLGVIMTGMGKDGYEGIREIKRLGGYCLAQDEESCVVYGMPKAIVDAGFADAIAPLNKISETINNAVSYGK